MPKQSGLLHFAASVARTLHLWPIIAGSGAFNRARRRKYPDTIVHLDVVITECCTLKCRDCSNLMQYYQKPENLDEDEVITSLKRLFRSMRVSQLKILGGEPFVCQKKLISLLDYLKEESDRYDRIDIITNGTIVPSEECLQALKDTPKLNVVFSNYGELSSKMKEFSDICRAAGIRHEVIDDEFWWDFGGVVTHEEKERKTQHRYDGCYSRRLCTTLYRGRLYVCPRQAHGIRLGIIPGNDTECIDIKKSEYSEPSVLHDAVYSLIDRREFTTACRYCRCDAAVKVPRAVQIERPIDVS